MALLRSLIAVSIVVPIGVAAIVLLSDRAAIYDASTFMGSGNWSVTARHLSLRTYRNPLSWEPTWGYIPRRGLHYGGAPAFWLSSVIPHPVLEEQLDRPALAGGRAARACISVDPIRGARGGAGQDYTPTQRVMRCIFGNESDGVQ